MVLPLNEGHQLPLNTNAKQLIIWVVGSILVTGMDKRRQSGGRAGHGKRLKAGLSRIEKFKSK
jgi:hypothetical protein